MFRKCSVCGGMVLPRLLGASSASVKHFNMPRYQLSFADDCHWTAKKMSTYSHIEEETKKFANFANNWWDQNGPMKPLHSFNKVRVPFIRDDLLLHGYGNQRTSKPLKGVSILEVGCGVGLLSENLARLGASVVGMDPSEEALSIAKQHRGNDLELKDLQYVDSLLEDLVAVGSLKFDCVVASEVVEHVRDPEDFIKMCVTLLKADGSLFISTINRTWVSRLLAILVAENLLGLLPQGTHKWEKFISPEEVVKILSRNNCFLRKLSGLSYNPFTDSWSFSEHHHINYILHATKNGE